MLESQLSNWTNPSSDTEQSKQERTERMIRQALDAHAPLNDCQFTVYTKGSYANNTNVRSDSDVDISVECTECIYWQEESIGAHPSNSSPYTGKWKPSTLRSEIIIALANKFPDQVDATGSTAIQINSSSARVDADVVPCFSFEYHFSGGNSVQGVKVFKTDGSSIENYPKQQIQYGRDKNNRTNYNYKKVVRILKRVQLLLVDADKFREVPSYFIESLVFNCPDELFSYSTSVFFKIVDTNCSIFKRLRSLLFLGLNRPLFAAHSCALYPASVMD